MHLFCLFSFSVLFVAFYCHCHGYHHYYYYYCYVEHASSTNNKSMYDQMKSGCISYVHTHISLEFCKFNVPILLSLFILLKILFDSAILIKFGMFYFCTFMSLLLLCNKIHCLHCIAFVLIL